MGMNHVRHAIDEVKNENTTTDVMTMEQMVSAVSRPTDHPPARTFFFFFSHCFDGSSFRSM
jgi:hypothetical protein